MECGEPQIQPAISWYDMCIAEEEEEERARQAEQQMETAMPDVSLPPVTDTLKEWAQLRAAEERRMAMTCEAERVMKDESVQLEEEGIRLRRVEANRRAAAAEARLQERLKNTPPLDEPMVVETVIEIGASEVEPDRSLGAIPKRRPIASVEARESHQAEIELDSYLQGAGKLTQRVPPLKNGLPPLRVLPVTSDPHLVRDGERWDEEITDRR